MITMIDITAIIEALLGLFVALVTTFLVPYIKEQTDLKRYEKAKNAVVIAVKAAEQIYKDTGIGKQKKAYVVDFLRDKGFVFDEEYVDCMIEAAVLELNKA